MAAHLRTAEEMQRLRARCVALWNGGELSLTLIAVRLGIGRTHVARLLETARNDGERVRERMEGANG